MSSSPARTWKQVWSERHLDPGRGSTLAQLMAADGLDTGFGNVGERAWTDFALACAQRMQLAAGDSVWEVGCGAGAFLHPLAAAGLRVGGLDGSPALIALARQHLPRGEWLVGDALEVAPPGRRFDWVVACGVFLYFPSLDYAQRVLAGMVARARRGVAILDVPDLARRAASLAMRRAALGEAAFAAKYSGLDHLYLDRAWMLDALRRAGAERVACDDQSIAGYGNAPFRFNAWGWLPVCHSPRSG